MNDDLNTPKALQVLWGLVRDESASGKYQTIKKIDEVFSLNLLKKEKLSISKQIQSLLEEREQAREEKNWKKADELRDKINKAGYTINDTPQGAVLKKI